MSDRFRMKVLSKLEEEINHLSGGTFEQFGYKVMPLIQPGDWSERGTTGDGAPRKGTVDTSSNAAAYVGEMSWVQLFRDGVVGNGSDHLTSVRCGRVGSSGLGTLPSA
jgi:hypothetical protein